MGGSVLEIGLSPKLFVDDEVVEQALGCRREMVQAVKHPKNPLIYPSAEDKHKLIQVNSVVYDRDAGQYVMWYQGYLPELAVLYYATSSDGLNWEFPKLGMYELAGSKDNNVLAGADGTPLPSRARVFFNPNQDDPKKKYIGLFQVWHYYVGYSPDGIHWEIDFDHIVWERGSGDGLGECYFVMYDERIKKWRGYVRVWIDNNTIRTGGYGESDDMTSWTGPKTQYIADSEWGLGAQVYDWCTWYDAGMYWALPHIFFSDMHPDPRQQQTMHLGLVYSRDGETWQAIDKSKDYITLGEVGEFDSHMVSQYPTPIFKDDEILFYYTGSSSKHDDYDPDKITGIALATGRRGRYLAMKADPGREAVIMTTPFRLQGDQLFINASTGQDGWVKAEFLNPKGQIIKTLDAEHSCDTFAGDSVEHLMTWRGNSSLQRMLGETTRMRFRFKNAEIFGFRFGESRMGIAEISAGPEPVLCRMTKTPPVIDGSLSDTVWEDFTAIGTIEGFVYHDRLEPAPVKSTVYVTRDGEAIYMAFDLEEPDIDNLVTDCKQGDLALYKDDCMQVEFQPGGPEGVVTILFFTARGIKAQNRIDPKRAHSGDPNPNPSWEVATSIAKTRWTAELKVPYWAIGVEPPKDGDSWRMNVHRFRHAGGASETYSWVCVFGYFSRHDRRGQMHFQ